MEPSQAGQSAQLVPDPFGGEPRPARWKGLFVTRPRSKAARTAERVGTVAVFFLSLHGLWGAAVFAALVGFVPWAIERRKRALRRRERETVAIER